MGNIYLVRWMKRQNRWDIWYKQGEREGVYAGSLHGSIIEWIEALRRYDPTETVRIYSN